MSVEFDEPRRDAGQRGRNMLLRPNVGVLLVALCVVALAGFSSGVAAQDSDSFVINSGASAGGEVSVGLNKSVVIDLPRDASDILVSNPGIADAVIRTPRRIYVTGIDVGQSNVIIFDRAGRQIVSLELRVERDPATLAQLLRRLIPGADINVEIVSDNVILTGTVRNAGDARRAEDIAGVFANGGANAQPPPQSSSSATEGGISISLSTQDDAPQSSIINMLSIQGEDQVHLKVTVAEVSRHVIKQLGIELNGSIGIGNLFQGSLGTQNPWAGTVIRHSLNSASGTIGDPNGSASLTATMRALEQTGMIRTLAEPTLTAISGESASFLAGGEFPVPVGRDDDAIDIEYKPFGVSLGFTPVVLSEGRISMRVKAEVSELSMETGLTAVGANGSDLLLPSIKVRRAESTIELPSGGSMVLGGLIRDSLRQSVSQVPGLGKLPILGTLFRSRDFQRDETELVIIVTPYLVKPVSRNALTTPDQGFAPASDAQAILLGNINRVYGANSSSEPRTEYRGLFGFIFD